MSTPIAGVTYSRTASDPTHWKAPGRPDLAGTAREDLVYGTYIPGPATTGPQWTGAFERVDFNGGINNINITSPGMYERMEFWGRVRPQTEGIIFKDCIFRGPDPATAASGAGGCIQNYGSNPPHFEMIDCKIDPSAWPNFATTTNQAYVLGVHGGNFTMRRTEIVWTQDAINYIGPTGSETLANAAYCLMEGNWLHKGYYINDWYGPNDGQPHCDGFQSNTGKNITIRGNMIGGRRDRVGYQTWPGGYNGGDDFWNAGLMLKQEVDASAINLIENVLIEKNWLSGGTSTINHAYGSDKPNAWATTIVRDNHIYQRDVDWGNYGLYGSGGPGHYIIKSSSIQAAYSNNTIVETGAPAPITRG